MKIAILSRNKNLYSTQRIVEAAEKRGHAVEVLDPLRCYVRLSTSASKIYYKGEPLQSFDAVIPRIGASITFYGTTILRQFEIMNVFALNTSDAILRARDKLRCLQLLAEHKVGFPKTVFGDNPEDTGAMLGLLGKPPHVIKLVEGAQGTGVVLADKLNSSRSLVEAFRGLYANFLVQEFVKEAKGADIRVFVVGGKIVAAMKRQAKTGEFRSNLHRGGSASVIKLSKKEAATAIKAAEIMGLGVAGVDLLQSSKGPLVLEVNSSPGLEGIEGSTGIDVAGVMMAYLEKNVR